MTKDKKEADYNPSEDEELSSIPSILISSKFEITFSFLLAL
jgi:hypothetical protein